MRSGGAVADGIAHDERNVTVLNCVDGGCAHAAAGRHAGDEKSVDAECGQRRGECGPEERARVLLREDDFAGLCSISELSLCDEIMQDCPEGEKCTPFHIEGCTYPRCVPIIGDKPAGETCTANEDAVDDCDADSWCYPGTFDLEQPAACISFCQDTADDSFCPEPSQICVFDDTVYWGPLGCRPSCDPLMPEGCEPWERCTFGLDIQPDFGCMIAGGVADGEVCESNQDCDSGACVLAESLLECAGERCCSPWCDLMAPSCAMCSNCWGMSASRRRRSTSWSRSKTAGRSRSIRCGSRIWPSARLTGDIVIITKPRRDHDSVVPPIACLEVSRYL